MITRVRNNAIWRVIYIEVRESVRRQDSYQSSLDPIMSQMSTMICQAGRLPHPAIVFTSSFLGFLDGMVPSHTV